MSEEIFQSLFQPLSAPIRIVEDVMSSILKKSSRKEKRIPLKGACLINPVNSLRQYCVQLNDLSQGGMSFVHKEPAFNQMSLVEIHFKVRGQRTITQRGLIVSAPNLDQTDHPGKYRFSIRFERRLTDEQLNLLLQSFDLQAPEMNGRL